MNKILNIIKVNELLYTSGQPTINEFNELKDNGFEVIINLSSKSIEKEDDIISTLGMSYFHIPVDFDEPEVYQVKLFLNILQSLGSNKVLVHCDKNYRVSAFMYVYHKYILNTPFENIDMSMFDQWTPSFKWQKIMKVSLDELKKA